jgi:hypothetical protein
LLKNLFEKYFSPVVKITPPSPSELLIQQLQSEVTFLREQVKFLTECQTPASLPPRQVIPSRPMKWDETAKKYVPKTDEEIELDRQGLRELGIC